jgi:hypothetical protein
LEGFSRQTQAFLLPRFFLPSAIVQFNTPFSILPTGQHLLLAMTDREQIKKWKLFTPADLTARFRAQGVGSIGLRPFFSSEMARLSAGCASDGLGLKAGVGGFHVGWQKESVVRMQTRVNGLHIFNDMVCFHVGL